MEAVDCCSKIRLSPLIMDQNKLNQFTQAALQSGYSMSEVSQFIKLQQGVSGTGTTETKKALDIEAKKIEIKEKKKTPEQKAKEKVVQEETEQKLREAKGMKKLSPVELKRKSAKEDAERIIGQLEELYFGNLKTNRDNLAYGRLGGLSQKLLSIAGMNASLKTYENTRNAVRPTLARAAGDVGNLNISEQQQAVAQLPTGFSTTDEAIRGFREARRRFGLSDKDLTSEYGDQRPAVNFKPTSNMRINKPLAVKAQEYLGQSETYPMLFSLLGGITTGGSPLGMGGGAAVGQYLKGSTQQGGIESLIPTKQKLTESGIKGTEYAIIGKILSVGGKYLSNALKFKTLNPGQIANFLRDKAAEVKPIINTTLITKTGDRIAKLFPHATKEWNLLKPAISKEMPTKDLLDVLTGWGKMTWTGTGTQRDKAASELMKHIYNAGRQSIIQQAPEVAKYTRHLKEIKDVPKLVSAAQKGTWLLLKLLGISKLTGGL